VSAVQSWRRYTVIGVLAFLAGVAAWSTMAWTDTVNYDVPKGQTAPPPVKADCGHLFGSGPSKRGSFGTSPGAKLSHAPCSGRTGRRVLVVLDAVVGAAVLFVLVTRFSPRPIDATPDPSS
jgi:hypothetical protein